ncbi:hypothetical protein PMI29_02310 [Pseudomonas sp. GM49]|nr:hypothetical protein PMI29_02310 [Pseudomonas sp. GM49]
MAVPASVTGATMMRPGTAFSMAMKGQYHDDHFFTDTSIQAGK